MSTATRIIAIRHGETAWNVDTRIQGQIDIGLNERGLWQATQVARALQAEVAKTDDVGLTYLVGAANEVIRIAPDPDRLALYGVTLQQLAGKVAQANRTLNTGK